MISREIGWSNQNNLTFGIIKQVNKIQKEVCCNCNITTTTTSSSSTSTTTTTTTLSPALRFTTTIDDPETQQGYVRFEVVEDEGSVDGVIDWGDGTIESINIPDDGYRYTFTHEYSEGSYTGVITLESPEQLLELFFDGND
jgi:hypothetical protein